MFAELCNQIAIENSLWAFWYPFKHYDFWSEELMNETKADADARTQLFENELKLKTELQKDRIQSIHKNISLGKHQNDQNI